MLLHLEQRTQPTFSQLWSFKIRRVHKKSWYPSWSLKLWKVRSGNYSRRQPSPNFIVDLNQVTLRFHKWVCFPGIIVSLQSRSLNILSPWNDRYGRKWSFRNVWRQAGTATALVIYVIETDWKRFLEYSKNQAWKSRGKQRLRRSITKQKINLYLYKSVTTKKIETAKHSVKNT